ncbi:MAG: TlyA family RNA methyltransferase [Oscillospiraceae bacterium]|nr:TlyA family RNA methyltransferase [Oscillospiraceae bacterium]
MDKIRIDVLLTEKGLAPSREKAKAMIMAGQVYVDQVRIDKAGTTVPDSAEPEIRGHAIPYVSRGGLKLEKALDVFSVRPEGRICVDCGASTGGFSDVLLKNGAKKIYAIDVGYGQLAWSIRNDPRVVVMERTNIRNVTEEQVPDEPDLAAIDVSFISLKLVFPVLRRIMAPTAEICCLIKPQFEAGREKVGKKGVVKEAATHAEVLEKVIAYAGESGFSVRGLTFSPVRGPEGNIEFLGHFVSGGTAADVDPAAVVRAAHDSLEGNV